MLLQRQLSLVPLNPGVGLCSACSFLPQPHHADTQRFEWTCCLKVSVSAAVQTLFQRVAGSVHLLRGHPCQHSVAGSRWVRGAGTDASAPVLWAGINNPGDARSRCVPQIVCPASWPAAGSCSFQSLEPLGPVHQTAGKWCQEQRGVSLNVRCGAPRSCAAGGNPPAGFPSERFLWGCFHLCRYLERICKCLCSCGSSCVFWKGRELLFDMWKSYLFYLLAWSFLKIHCLPA